LQPSRTPQASRTIADGIPGAWLVTLDGTGHVSFAEEPDRFRDAVVMYLQAEACATHEP
jgi:proline iminopeptidase